MLSSMRRSAAMAAAIILTAAMSMVSYGNFFSVVEAFAPPAQIKGYSNAAMKGRGTNARNAPLSSSVTPTEPAAKSTPSLKSTPKKNKRTFQKKKRNNPKITNKSKSKSNSSSSSIRRNKLKSKPKSSTTPTTSKSFKPLKDLQLGSTLSGKVVDICDFGAFIDIGYATQGSRPGTALLHISQIRNDRIENIRDVIRPGDVIENARVITVDLAKGEVGLSLRKPRTKRREFTTLKVGDKLNGKVDKVMPYGVFVDVGVNVNALLHISRITGGAIENIRHHLNEGDPVSVHVIDVDEEKKTLAVSMLDKKADQYLDRRMSQRMKKFFGTASRGLEKGGDVGVKDDPSELDYFDQVIQELEYALRERK